jgi:hypothetical protein
LNAIFQELDWQAIQAAYRRLAERPAELATYLAEAESIAAVDLEELGATAAEEYPEYNP